LELLASGTEAQRAEMIEDGDRCGELSGLCGQRGCCRSDAAARERARSAMSSTSRQSVFDFGPVRRTRRSILPFDARTVGPMPIGMYGRYACRRRNSSSLKKNDQRPNRFEGPPGMRLGPSLSRRPRAARRHLASVASILALVSRGSKHRTRSTTCAAMMPKKTRPSAARCGGSPSAMRHHTMPRPFPTVF
jgi:hypothetical protein